MGRVLVVEDDDTIGAALESSLRTQGHQVWWDRKGRDAVRRAESTVVDLVLLDLGLPDLDGVEVCRRLRDLQPFTVVVMLTARSDEADVVLGLEAGADDYLVKPVSLAELHARIRAHLRRANPASTSRPSYPIGDLVVEPTSRRATINGRRRQP